MCLNIRWLHSRCSVILLVSEMGSSTLHWALLWNSIMTFIMMMLMLMVCHTDDEHPTSLFLSFCRIMYSSRTLQVKESHTGCHYLFLNVTYCSNIMFHLIIQMWSDIGLGNRVHTYYTCKSCPHQKSFNCLLLLISYTYLLLIIWF